MKEQLEKNAYYFKFLRKNTFHYTYIEDKNRLYRLEDEELVESKFENLLHLLEGQEIEYDFDFYNSFDPNNYLVSPFNDTERFLKDEYYLTDRQDEVKSDILKNISTEKKFINIQGGFGSGKSLVLYDVSKQLQKKDFKCLIIHCGKLNDGHTLLRTEFSKIDEIKNLKNYSLSKFDWILFDEVQRLKESQLNDIMKKVKGHSQLKCIFSGDPEQWLKEEEESANIHRLISEIDGDLLYNTKHLDSKVRCNDNLHYFTKGLFDRRKINRGFDYSNINLVYFDTFNLANKYINKQKVNRAKVLKYTDSINHSLPYDAMDYTGRKYNSHLVIGQEFDHVLTVIDENFGYNKEGKLVYIGDFYYHPVKMLCQNVTRAKKSLTLVIVNNNKIFDKLLSIKNKHFDLEL